MAKLTLSIDSEVVKKAKKYLQTDKDSLSSLVERYFSLLIRTNENKKDVTPIVKSLTGVLKGVNVDIDYKETITDYLEEKYK